MANENTPYEEGSGFLGMLTRAGIVAGGIYAGQKFVRDREGFKEGLTKIKNVIMPVVEQEPTPRSESLVRARTRIKSASSIQSKRMQAKRDFRAKDQAALDAVKSGREWSLTESAVPADILDLSKKYKFSKLDQVTDAFGNRIGGEVEAALRSLEGNGLHVGSKVTFNGTTAIFEIADKGKQARKLSIPFVMHDETGAQINRLGGHYSIAPRRGYMVNRGGELGMQVLDENSNILKTLTDPQRLLHTALQDKKFATEFEGAALKNGSNLESFIEKTILRMTAGNDLAEVSLARMIRSAMSNLSKDHVWGTPNAKSNWGFLGPQVLSDSFTRHQLDPAFPGLKSLQVGTSPFTFGIDGVMTDSPVVQEATINAFNSMATRAKNPNSNVFTAGRLMRNTQTGEIIVDDFAFDAAAAATTPGQRSFYQNFNRNVAQASGADQTAQGMFTAREANTLSQRMTEGFKSHKNYRLVRNVGKRELAFVKDGQPVLPVAAEALARIRTAPMYVNNAASGMLSSLQNENMIHNVLGVVDPFVEDMMSFDRNTLKAMKSRLPGSISIDKFIDNDSYISKTMVNIEEFQGGKWNKVSEVPFHQVYTDDSIRDELISNANRRVRAKKGTAIGIKDIALPLSDQEEIENLMEREDRIVRLRAETIITNEDMRLAAAANVRAAGEEGGIQLYMGIQGTPYKVAFYGSTTRSATHKRPGGKNRFTQALRRLEDLSGGVAGSEASFAYDLFSKHWPLNRAGAIVSQKNTAEYLQFLTSSISGHTWAYADRNIKLSGGLASRFAQYTGNSVAADGTLNLTELFKGGKLRWMFNDDAAAIGQQVTDAATVLGAMRTRLADVRPGGFTISDAALGSSQAFADRLVSDWELNKNVGKYWGVMDLVKPGSLSAEDRAAFNAVKGIYDAAATGVNGGYVPWYMQQGIMPQELHQIAQGGRTFSEMRIGVKDMPSFLGRTEILGELLSQSSTSPRDLLTQTKLFQMSLSGDKRFIDAVKEYGKSVGHEFKLLSGDDLRSMLGGEMVNGQDFMDIVKHPNFFSNTIFAQEKNPFGFLYATEAGPRYAPGAELLGGGTFVPSTGKVTYSDMGARFFKMLREGTINGDGLVTNAAMADFYTHALSELTSTKSGLLRSSAMKVENAIYAKHISDTEFLHNSEMMSRLEALAGGAKGSRIAGRAEEVVHMLDNTAIMSSMDFRKSIGQYIKDAHQYAQSNEIKMSKALDEMFGTDNFLSRYYNEINHIKNLSGDALDDTLAQLSASITQLEVEKSRSIKTKIMDLATGIKDKTNSTVQRSLMKDFEDTMRGFWVRYPTIYGSSYSAGMVLVDDKLSERQVALGRFSRLNLNADTDGDNIMIKWLIGKGARNETMSVINTTQKYTAEFMKVFGDKKGVFKQLMGVKETISPLAGMNAEALARTLLTEAPKSTAIAAYFTKAMTGAFNIKALGTKGYLQTVLGGKNISDSAYNKVSAFFSTMPSKITEQEVISSKHLENILGAGGKIENVTALFNRLTPKKMQNIIREANGGLHPLMLMAAIEGKKEMGGYGKIYDQVADLLDMQLHTRRLNEQQFRGAMSLLHDDGGKIDSAWTKYTNLMNESKVMPFYSRQEFVDAGFGGARTLDIIRDSMAAGAEGGNSSESIRGVISKAMKNGGLKTVEERFRAIFGDLHANNYNIKSSMEMFAPEAATALAEQRSFIGAKQVNKVINWLTAPKKGLGRTAAILGTIGAAITAVNYISGDGTPENPNDLPSVSNPSFSAPRGMRSQGRMTLDSGANYNTSMSLLTDSNVSMESAMGRLSTMVNSNGHNSVTVRHDGTDPYKQHMSYYN